MATKDFDFEVKHLGGCFPLAKARRLRSIKFTVIYTLLSFSSINYETFGLQYVVFLLYVPNT